MHYNIRDVIVQKDVNVRRATEGECRAGELSLFSLFHVCDMFLGAHAQVRSTQRVVLVTG